MVTRTFYIIGEEGELFGDMINTCAYDTFERAKLVGDTQDKNYGIYEVTIKTMGYRIDDNYLDTSKEDNNGW